MTKKISKWMLCFMLILVMSLLVSCSKEKEEQDVNQDDIIENTEDTVVEDEQDQEKEEVEKVELNNLNYLTGLNDMTNEAVGKRPVAIMVNNVKKALPQYGVSEADVIFDIVVEADQTRMMALFADYTQMPYMCSIRSARYYYAALAKGFDAFFVHWGEDPPIVDYLNSLNLDKLNGITNDGKLFGRNGERLDAGYAKEHSSDFDGDKIAGVIEKKGWRTDLLEEKKTGFFNFHEYGTVVKPNGDACEEVFIDFGAQTATFKYDVETDTYLKEFNGKAHMDEATDKQLAFTNVFVLETSIKIRDEGGYKTLDWKGGEDAVGYYVSNGAVQKIHWSKADEASNLKFFTEDGEELVINRGKSYIAINYKNQAEFK